jgi:hypothetical protein
MAVFTYSHHTEACEYSLQDHSCTYLQPRLSQEVQYRCAAPWALHCQQEMECVVRTCPQTLQNINPLHIQSLICHSLFTSMLKSCTQWNNIISLNWSFALTLEKHNAHIFKIPFSVHCVCLYACTHTCPTNTHTSAKAFNTIPVFVSSMNDNDKP